MIVVRLMMGSLALCVAMTGCRREEHRVAPAEPPPKLRTANEQSDQDPARTSKSPRSNPPSDVAPEIIWLAEMAPFPSEFRIPADELPGSSAEVKPFAANWSAMSVTVASAVTSDALAAISRWSRERTLHAALPARWIDGLDMKPLAATPDGHRILFGQATEDGILLPSDRPIVHRRLLVAAVFDVRTKAIPTVYITIRGWVEE